jgi:broad specificity phosphatase PhoE
VTVLLARHGETAFNRERRFQGQNDAPLNETGRGQAAALAERMADEGIDDLWCSPLARAAETAAIVGERLGLQATPDPRLAELDVGEWVGRLYEEVLRDDPEGFAGWRAPTPEWRAPGGESVPEQQARVRDALADIRARTAGTALVVCHGGVVCCALLDLHGRSTHEYHHWHVPNTGVVRL